jgi:hypothetical protein
MKRDLPGCRIRPALHPLIHKGLKKVGRDDDEYGRNGCENK